MNESTGAIEKRKTEFVNEVPRCGRCHRPATCLKQSREDFLEWEYRCNVCCSHSEDAGDARICIQAVDIPSYYSALDLQARQAVRELEEAFRVIERRLGVTARQRIEGTIESRSRTDTCLGCGGNGRRRDPRTILTDWGAATALLGLACLSLRLTAVDSATASSLWGLGEIILLAGAIVLAFGRCRRCDGSGEIVGPEDRIQ